MSQAETSFVMVSALIAADTPRQIGWHLNGAIRNGATVAEVQAVRKISIEVARIAGIKWKNEIPDVWQVSYHCQPATYETSGGLDRLQNLMYVPVKE